MNFLDHSVVAFDVVVGAWLVSAAIVRPQFDRILDS